MDTLLIRFTLKDNSTEDKTFTLDTVESMQEALDHLASAFTSGGNVVNTACELNGIPVYFEKAVEFSGSPGSATSMGGCGVCGGSGCMVGGTCSKRVFFQAVRKEDMEQVLYKFVSSTPMAEEEDEDDYEDDYEDYDYWDDHEDDWEDEDDKE